MAGETQLIPSHLLPSESFKRDLRALLRLTSDQIIALSRLAADSASGFSPSAQAPTFAEAASISSDEARRAILIAEYLYERCREHRISPDDAVAQLVDVAPSVGIEEITDRAAALGDLLSVKDLYETEGYARRQTVAVVSHFVDLDGIWDVRPVFHRETGDIATNLTVLLLKLSWHDQDGTSHSAAIQLDEDDWASLRERVQKLENERVAVTRYLERL